MRQVQRKVLEYKKCSGTWREFYRRGKRVEEKQLDQDKMNRKQQKKIKKAVVHFFDVSCLSLHPINVLKFFISFYSFYLLIVIKIKSIN